MGDWTSEAVAANQEAIFEALDELVELALDRLAPGATMAAARSAFGMPTYDDLDPEEGGELTWERPIAGDGGLLCVLVSGGGGDELLSRVEVDVSWKGAEESAWREAAAALTERLVARLGAPREDYRGDVHPAVRWEDGARFVGCEARWGGSSFTLELEGIPEAPDSIWAVVRDFDGIRAFILGALPADGAAPFGWHGARPGMELAEIETILGPPKHASFKREEQQTLTYEAELDHPTEGRRSHHVARLVAVAYHREPAKSLRLNLGYFGFGPELGPKWAALADGLHVALRERFGAPTGERSARGTKESAWERSGERLWLKTAGGELILEMSERG